MAEDNSQASLQPEVRVVGQFVREMSWENIMAQRHGSDDARPNVQVQVTLDAQKMQPENLFESSIKLKISSKNHGTDTVIFLLNIDYVGRFQVTNVPEDQLEAMLMLECPRLIFPFLRRVVSDVTRDGGFPPLNLENIDFAALYRKELMRRQESLKPQTDA